MILLFITTFIPDNKIKNNINSDSMSECMMKDPTEKKYEPEQPK